MEAIFFYWFSWIGWVIVTFFWKQTKNQYLFSNLILILIISASYHFTFSSFEVNLAYVLLLIFGCFVLARVKLRRLFHYLIISLTIVGLATGFRLFFIYDPVMILFHPAWMLAFIIFLLVVSIVKIRQYRIPLLILGLCQSELVLSLFLQNIYGTQTIGEPFILDVTIISIFLLYAWQRFEQLTNRLSFTVRRSVKA